VRTSSGPAALTSGVHDDVGQSLPDEQRHADRGVRGVLLQTLPERTGGRVGQYLRAVELLRQVLQRRNILRVELARVGDPPRDVAGLGTDHVAVATFWRMRGFRSLNGPLIAIPPFAVVVPPPVIAPPDQVRSPDTVTVSVPESAPPESVSVVGAIVSPLSNVALPELIESAGPTEPTFAVEVKVTFPPATWVATEAE